MSYNGSGTYNLYTPGNPTVTGTTITSTWANNSLNDIATALSTAICKDGQTTTTANIDFAQGITVATNKFIVNSATGVMTASSAFMSPITNSLGADVNLNNTGSYFDGPSIAQGTSGTWFVSGTVTVTDSAGAAAFNVKLWDGVTVIASSTFINSAAGKVSPISLSGFITSPVGNLRISVNDETSVNGVIRFNRSGLSKDSTISAIRIG